MRRLFILLVFLVASVWLGLTVIKHPGYLFIYTQPWMVQMPLWFAFMSLLIIFGLFFVLVDSIDRIQFLWYRMKNWFKYRREQKSYSKTQQGLSLLIQNDWYKAERLLIQGAESASEPLINYLAAAEAAQKQEQFDKRDKYLRHAYQVAPHADLAIGITQAELQLEHNQLEQASATLNRLRQQHPRHIKVLRLLVDVYTKLSDWQSLQDIMYDIRRAKAYTQEELQKLEVRLASHLLMRAGAHNQEQLNRVWNDLPKTVRRDVAVIHVYCQQLVSFGDEADAKDIIRRTLKSVWSDDLVKLYSTFHFDNLNKQLVLGAAWLKAHGAHAELLLFLGKICVQVQLWGKAKDYFSKCLELGPNKEALLAYGRLLTQLGESDKALEQYQETLQEMNA